MKEQATENHLGVVAVMAGEPAQDYQGGNLLNAIDDVVNYFIHNRDMDEGEISDHLKLYAARMGR